MLLAVDAGGTSTRAVLLDVGGRVHGYGRAGSGNPTASGIAVAAASIAEACAAALAGRGSAETAVLAMAGEQSAAYLAEVSARLGALGVGRVILEHDLLAIFCSGTPADQGYALIAGTGTVAARVRAGQLDRVVGGRGWLLGDAGSGFWIGQKVARAVVSALDGLGPQTALTSPVLAALGVDPGEGAVRRIVSAVHARRPVQLSELAPLAFAYADDPVARQIVLDGCDALIALVATVQAPGVSGLLVVGGSVVVHGVLGTPVLRDRLLGAVGKQVVSVADGALGACVLVLRHSGVTVDQPLFETVRTSLAGWSAR